MTPKEDLERSGLSEETIAAMRVQFLTAKQVQQICKFDSSQCGYLIPYFDFSGERIDYHRIRLLPQVGEDARVKGKDVRYHQDPGTANHAYLPPTVSTNSWFDVNQPLVIVEGEKKAAAGAQVGLITMGLGGINSWRSRNIPLTENELNQDKKGIWTLRVPNDFDVGRVIDQVVPELLKVSLDGREVQIAFDSDYKENENIQIAAFELGIWLQGEGAKVEVVLLPHKPNPGKCGLDDYLKDHSPHDFWALDRTPPKHPKVRTWLRRKLDISHSKRSDQVKCAQAILNSLDARGQRFVDPQTGGYYFWDRTTSILHAFRWDSQEIRQIRLSSFGVLVQEQFAVGAVDASIMGRVADIYTAQKGIRHVKPRRVSYAEGDHLYYQLSDSFVAKVGPGGVDIVDNGTDDVLFVAGQVAPLSIPPELLVASRDEGPMWIKALQTVHLKPLDGMSIEQTHIFLAALFYLSPWFRRWRGLMLPIEILVSEPGSGKSFMMNLRKGVLTGNPSLDNPPISLKDWYSQLINAGAIWICDNLGEMPKEMRDIFSDELARLTTDPSPGVEMRKLYTTVDVGHWPVDATFAITSIKEPFWKPDVLQRSILLRLNAIPTGERDSMWYQRQVEGEGRAKWVLNHLRMAQRFLSLVSERWQDNYLSQHRLMHFEQSMLLMGEAIGYGPEMRKIVGSLFKAVQSQIVEGDPVMKGLAIFSKEMRTRLEGKQLTASAICQWATMDLQERFKGVRTFHNPLQLSKYLESHAYDVSQITGIGVGRDADGRLELRFL